MKVTALYKTYRGKKFIIPSLESIYPYMDNIVMMNSEIGWMGDTKGNNIAPVVAEWKKEHDKAEKIQLIHYDTQNQNDQYRMGLELINRHYPCDWVLIIDSDEVWTDRDLTALLSFARICPWYEAIKCSMHTYVKDMHYRIAPAEPCKPVVLVRPWSSFPGVRGNQIKNCSYCNVHMHHFTMVRESMEDIREKIVSSNIADGSIPVNVDVWLQTKWDKMPYVQDFHYSFGFEHCWKRIRVVDDNDLPVTVLTNEVPA